MSDFLDLPENIGNVKVLEILPKDEWIEQSKLAVCDIYKKDGEIRDYYKHHKLGKAEWDTPIKTETKAFNKLQREWKKAGGIDLLYENYVANRQAANMQAIEVNKDVTIDYNKGISDTKFRPVYFIGGAILLTIIVIFKNRK